MSLNGVLRSGVSGMNAQATKLSVVADNIQNANTTGYKRGSVEFTSLILESSGNSYNSGAVETRTRYAISERVGLTYTSSASDLGISGNGFFVVNDAKGTPFLTRAGNFVLDGATGELNNAAGFTLMGYSLENGADVTPTLNSLQDLVPVNVASLGMKATPSSAGTFSGNLPDNEGIPATPPPAGATFNKKSSLRVFDNIGNPVKLDIYLTKTAGDTWEMTIYDSSVPGDFPGSPLAAPTELTFDGFGQLSSATTTTVDIPNGQEFTLDLTGMTQLGGAYDATGTANGNGPSAVKGTEFATDGTVYAVYEDGSRVAAYKVPLATVASPDNLTPRAGNVFQSSLTSGEYLLGFAETGGFGSIEQGALEQSNVDIGTELTNMIEAQTAYTANSKTFQTGNEMLDVLMSLKR